MTGGTLVEGLYGVCVGSFFTEELGGKRIEQRRERFSFQDRLADWQTAPKIAGTASDGLYEHVAKEPASCEKRALPICRRRTADRARMLVSWGRFPKRAPTPKKSPLLKTARTFVSASSGSCCRTST